MTNGKFGLVQMTRIARVLLSSSSRPSELLKCGKCGLVHYCSRSCQRQHWQHHKWSCMCIGGIKLVAKRYEHYPKVFDEGQDGLIDLKMKLQTEKRDLDEFVQKRAALRNPNEANVESTRAEKKCEEKVGVLEDSNSKVKEEMRDVVRWRVTYAPGLATLRVYQEGIPVVMRFLTKFSESSNGKVQTAGRLLFKRHNTKGAISLEFESVADLENATAWLNHNKKAYAEKRDNSRVHMAALQSSSDVLLHLFLGDQIKGLKRLSYLTRLEAFSKYRALEVALPTLSAPLDPTYQSLAADVNEYKQLWWAIHTYDRRYSALLHIQLKIECGGINKGKQVFVRRWVVAK